MTLSLPTLTNPTLPNPTQLKNRLWVYGKRGIEEMAWHERSEKKDGAIIFRPSLPSSPLDNVVGGKSTTTTTTWGAVASFTGDGLRFQKPC